MPGIEKMRKRDIVFGIMIAVSLVIFLSPFASKLPDGLEKAAQDKGFLKQEKSLLPAIIADYLFPGIKNETLATVLAGLIGVFIIFSLTYFLAGFLKKGKTD